MNNACHSRLHCEDGEGEWGFGIKEKVRMERGSCEFRMFGDCEDVEGEWDFGKKQRVREGSAVQKERLQGATVVTGRTTFTAL